MGICAIARDVLGDIWLVPRIAVPLSVVCAVPIVSCVVCVGALRAPWGLRVPLMALLIVLVPIGVLGQLVIIALISFQVSGLSGLH